MRGVSEAATVAIRAIILKLTSVILTNSRESKPWRSINSDDFALGSTGVPCKDSGTVVQKLPSIVNRYVCKTVFALHFNYKPTEIVSNYKTFLRNSLY